jgi:hypothetical protein
MCGRYNQEIIIVPVGCLRYYFDFLVIPTTYKNLNKQQRATLSYADQTYTSLNKQPKGTVIVLVIPTTLKIV